MTEVTLTIHSAGRRSEHEMEGGRLIIGRAEGGARVGRVLSIEDEGLDPRHASINREGSRVWVLDEGSRGGTFLNGRRVPPQGAPLADGDEIFLGDHTTLVARLRANSHAREEHTPRERPANSQDRHEPPRQPSPFVLGAAVLCLGLLAVTAVAFFARKDSGEGRDNSAREAARTRATAEDLRPTPTLAPTPAAEPAQQQSTQAGPADDGTPLGPEPSAVAPDVKTYLKMSREEQLQFLEARAQHVSTMMGNRPYAFNEEVLGYIKQYVDGYARRVGNNARSGWGADLRVVFARARTQYAPHIIRAFKARGVPPVVGLYLVMIETEYYNFPGENSAGAAGLFQFIPGTALLYGIQPSERTNVEKMAPAAARYMSDRITEFGSDSMSVALAIAGYNRSPDSVRRDLRDVLSQRGVNKERSFWTLVANSDKLDHWFQGENIKYVPKFFAAAIVGETPWAFGLEMRKLSTYTSFEGPAAARAEPTPPETPAQAPARQTPTPRSAR